jgi:hypothetical protein
VTTEILDPRTGELIDTDCIPGLATVAALHHEQLSRLGMDVEQLQDEVSSTDAESAPWTWRSLTGAAAARQWHELAEWVGWVRGRYPLARQIPPCWWRHPELVEELTALWLAWKDAYATKHAHLAAPADWHARWLPDLLGRIGAGGWNIGCEGVHKDLVPGLYDARRVDDEQAFRDHLNALTRHVDDDQRSSRVDLDDDTITSALGTGEARRLGDSADSPVTYDGHYWALVDDRWVEVEDPDTVEFLTDAERRLRLADQAVRRSEE